MLSPPLHYITRMIIVICSLLYSNSKSQDKSESFNYLIVFKWKFITNLANKKVSLLLYDHQIIVNVPQTPGKTKGRKGRGRKKEEEEENQADQTVSQPARSTRATRSRARADNSVLEETLAEPLNTTRATRKNPRKTKAETSVLEETVTEPAKTSRSSRRTTKTAVVEEESAKELQPTRKSNKR